MKKGNGLIISVIFIAICIVLILFIAIMFMSHVNSILYNMKLEMYSINRAAIIAVNKNKTSIDDFSYSKKAFKDYFQKAIREAYDLDSNYKNSYKLISSVDIIEYEIYEADDKDTYTGKKCENRVIHTVLNIEIKPIIMKSIFEKIFVFTIHEDVNLNMITGG